MKVQHACRTEAGPSSTPPSTPTGSRSPEVPIPRMLGAGSDVGRGAGGPDVRCRGRSTRLATAGLPRGGDLDRTMHAQPLPVDHPRVPRRWSSVGLPTPTALWPPVLRHAVGGGRGGRTGTQADAGAGEFGPCRAVRDGSRVPRSDTAAGLAPPPAVESAGERSLWSPPPPPGAHTGRCRASVAVERGQPVPPGDPALLLAARFPAAGSRQPAAGARHPGAGRALLPTRLRHTALMTWC